MKPIGTDPRQQSRILRDLDEVGIRKAVGYLPIPTIKSFLDASIDSLTENYTSRGMAVLRLSPAETCIKGGALFVYDSLEVKEIMEKHSNYLAVEPKNISPEKLIRLIANTWYDSSDPIMPLIRDLYRS